MKSSTLQKNQFLPTGRGKVDRLTFRWPGRSQSRRTQIAFWIHTRCYYSPVQEGGEGATEHSKPTQNIDWRDDYDPKTLSSASYFTTRVNHRPVGTFGLASDKPKHSSLNLDRRNRSLPGNVSGGPALTLGTTMSHTNTSTFAQRVPEASQMQQMAVKSKPHTQATNARFQVQPVAQLTLDESSGPHHWG